MPQQETPAGIDGTAPDISDFEATDRLLRNPPIRLSTEITPLGWRLRVRAADRLSQRMETALRGGVAPFSTEAAALVVIKGAARDLRQAAVALAAAAVRLREHGDGLGANRAYMAGRAVEAAAEGIDP
jgi:hypothetical protein